MPGPNRASSPNSIDTLTDVEEDDLVFAGHVLSYLAWSLEVRGRARIWPTRTPDTIKARAEQSGVTMKSLAESSTEDMAEGLGLAQQVLEGLANHIGEFGRARINLHYLGVDDTIRSTDFVRRLEAAQGAVGGFVPEPSVQ